MVSGKHLQQNVTVSWKSFVLIDIFSLISICQCEQHMNSFKSHFICQNSKILKMIKFRNHIGKFWNYFYIKT